MKKGLTNILILFALLGCLAPAEAQIYRDSTASMHRRVEDLLQRLTLDEKLSLMEHQNPALERFGLPAYSWWNEALHGVARNGNAVVYPMPIALAATFDTALVAQTYRQIQQEAEYKHYQSLRAGNRGDYTGLTFFTPNINILRDPRWGRGMETFGEDPYLTATMGLAVVRNLRYSCVKHLAVHSGPEAARHRFDAQVSQRDLWNTYLPAFEYIVRQGNPAMVMTAYNRINGTPCSTNPFLLTEILRNQWHYQGIVVTDCWALNDCWERDPKTPRHETHPDAASAASDAFGKEIDLECGSGLPALKEAVKKGLVSEEQIDDHLRRILPVRLQIADADRKGLEPSFSPTPDLPYQDALESLVLLKNNGVLPLRTQRIAIVGPNADDSVMTLGNYNGSPTYVCTPLEAFQKRLSADAPQPEAHRRFAFFHKKKKDTTGPLLYYHKGCSWTEKESHLPNDFWEQIAQCDVVLFFGGLTPELEGEELQVETEGFSHGDRTRIELPIAQQRLIHEIHHQTGKPIVLVLSSGSAIALGGVASEVDAIVSSWYGGQEIGNAIYDALMGHADVFGRLPVTFYRQTSQLPDYEDYSMVGRTYRYLDCQKAGSKDVHQPLYPFGYGCNYRDLQLQDVEKGPFPLSISANVKCADRAGITLPDSVPTRAVVQLYLTNLDNPAAPRKTLVGYQSIFLSPGQIQPVLFQLSPEWLRTYDSQTGRLQEPAKGTRFRLSVGFSSATADLTTFDFTY